MKTTTSTRNRLGRIAAAFVTVSTIAIGVGADHAHAFTYSTTGAAGATSNWTATNVNLAPAYPVNSRVIAGPTFTAYRNGSVPVDIPQKVTATVNLFRSNGGSWVLVNTKTLSGFIMGGYGAINFVSDSLRSWARGYYYTTQVVVRWNDQYARVAGTLTYNAAHASDFRCNVALCTPYNGYVLVQ